MSESQTRAEPKGSVASPGSALRQVIEASTLRIKADGYMETYVKWRSDAQAIETQVREIKDQAKRLSDKVDGAPPAIQQKFAPRMRAFGEKVTQLLANEIEVKEREKKAEKARSALGSLQEIDKQLDAALADHAAKEEEGRKVRADQELLTDFSARVGPWRAKAIDPAIGKAALSVLTQMEGRARPVLAGTAPLADADRAGFSAGGLDKLGLALDQAETATRVAKEVAAERLRLAALLRKTVPDKADAGIADALPRDVKAVLARREQLRARIDGPAASVADLAGIEEGIGAAAEMLGAVQALVDERRRLGGLLDAAMAAGAGPGDVAPGALPGDLAPATERRKAVAASIARMPAMEDSPGMVGEIAGLTALIEGVRATVAERARLVLVLDAALPAGARPEDVAAGATAQDVAGVMAERAAILERINTHGTDLDTIPAEIDGLKPMIRGVVQKLAAIRKEAERLRAERDGIAKEAAELPAAHPAGATAAQIQALADGRAAMDAALAAPVTKEGNLAAREAVKGQQTLHAATAEAVRALRKTSEAEVRPALQRLRQLEKDLENLKIGPAVDLTAPERTRRLIADAQEAGDWAEALRQAGELEKQLAGPEKTAAEMDAFRNGGKLLPATYDAVVKKLGAAITIDRVKGAVADMYTRQCEVTRDDWLTHLGVAGANVKVGDPNGPHYTTFNAAVMPGGSTASIDQSLDALCAQLFETGIDPMRRIHATVVDGNDRYHKYWGGVYANHYNVRQLWSTNPALDKKLSEWYDKLVADMRKKVKEAQDAHGRIGNNRRGPEVEP